VAEDQWMVALWCDVLLTTWPCGASEEWRASRIDSRDLVASGVKCGLHGGKKSKTKLSTGAGVG
jgi:hypothetical protein